MCVYLFIYMCHASWPTEKRYRPGIWHTILPLTLFKPFFFVFSKKWPWGPLPSKKFRVTGIFRISARLPYFKSFHFKYIQFQFNTQFIQCDIILNGTISPGSNISFFFCPFWRLMWWIRLTRCIIGSRGHFMDFREGGTSVGGGGSYIFFLRVHFWKKG